MKQNRKWIGIAALVMALMLAVGMMISASAAGTLSADEIDAIVNTTTDASAITSPFTEAVQAVRNSVVMVNNYTIRYNYGYGYGFGFGYGYGNGRGNGNSSTEELAGTGSGVLISQYGHVLTNYHVIEDASRVTIYDGENEYDATIEASDESLDVAVLLCPQLKNLPVAQLGDSDQLQEGEWAIVIGNPLGKNFFRSVTVGVVSSLERTYTNTTRDVYGRRTKSINEMIQVDAAINSGNSGGGMFNVKGQLMGIPSLKYSSNYLSSTQVDNIGMCIPINSAKAIIREALEKYDAAAAQAAMQQKDDTPIVNADTSSRPRMGITVTTLATTNQAVSQGVLPNGAYVKEVEAGSPAEAAGIQEGDIIVQVNDTIVASSNELVNAISGFQEGDVLQVKLFRAPNILDAKTVDEIGEGEYIDVTVTLKIILAPAA